MDLPTVIHSATFSGLTSSGKLQRAYGIVIHLTMSAMRLTCILGISTSDNTPTATSLSSCEYILTSHAVGRLQYRPSGAYSPPNHKTIPHSTTGHHCSHGIPSRASSSCPLHEILQSICQSASMFSSVDINVRRRDRNMMQV